MAGTTIQLVGNLTADPELRVTQSGVAVANLQVVVTSRVKQGDTWKDGTPSFYRVTVWREYAEHVAESLAKGTHVVVLGRMLAREWEDADGTKRTSYEVQADEVAPSLRWATARVEKASVGERHNRGGRFDDEPPF